MKKTKNILVIGCGIIGSLTAYNLAKRGHKVTVIEREESPAQKCSKANGGQISVCNAQTWNTWENVFKGLKWMTQPGAPLLIRPDMNPKKIKWLLGFLGHTIKGSHLDDTLTTINIGKISSNEYDQIIEQEGIQFDQLKRGMMHVYSSEKSLENAMKYQSLFEENGVQWQHLSKDDVVKYDPALANFNELKGGIITKSDWTGDARMFSEALQKICEEKFGAIFLFGHAVDSKHLITSTSDGKHSVLVRPTTQQTEQEHFRSVSFPPQFLTGFDNVVICNGHEIGDFAANLGDSMNVFPVKGYSITIENAGDAAPSVSLLDDDKKIVCSKLGNRLRVAGTAELDGTSDHIRQERIDPLIQWVNSNFPDVDTSEYTPWACLRPMNSNMMPIVKESKRKGVFYHGGHGHLGWTLGAGTAKWLMQIMKC